MRPHKKTGLGLNGKTPWNLITRVIDGITSLSYQTLFFVWISLALIFAGLYFLLGNVPGHGPEPLYGMAPLAHFLNSLYYSIITATSTGYGDITPLGFSKVLASMQSILALFIFAVFVTKLVSHRQDIALRQIHKLAFEDTFHNIREGLHIVRKDYDRIILRAGTEHALTEQEWEDLAVAYRQAQSFLRRIPDFYDPLNRLYTLDIRREELLHDGVKRTLKRVLHVLEILQSKHLDWTAQNESLEELRELVQLVNMIVRFWHRQSPHKRNQAFEELLHLNDEIHRTIEAAVEKKNHTHNS